ncbi:MAG: HIT domain-containing protein [Spirochaetia bacterium]
MEKTIFEKIIDGEMDGDIVYQDDDVMAIRDIQPQAPVHVLVIPKKKIKDFASLKSVEKEYIGTFMQKVAGVAENLNLERGYRIVFNVGEHGQQSVLYLHAHLLGGRQMEWPPG